MASTGTAASGFPGVSAGPVPLRPLSVGEVLDGAMAALRRHPGPTLGVGVVVAAVQLLLLVPAFWLVADLSIGRLADPNGVSDADVVGALVGLSLAAGLQSLVTSACGAVSTAAASVAIGESMVGRSVSVRDVWTRLRPRAGRVLGLALTLAAIYAVVLATVSVVWIFLAGVLGLAMPALVLERTGVFAALGRSWRLSIGGFGRVLGIRVLARVIGLILQVVLGYPATVLAFVVMGLLSGSEPPSSAVLLLGTAIAGLGILVPSVVVTPFLGCVDALLYADRRMRAEGLDVELLLERRAGRSGVGPRTAPIGAPVADAATGVG